MTYFQSLGYFLLSSMSNGWQLLELFEICLKQRKLPRFVISLWFSSYNIFGANIKPYKLADNATKLNGNWLISTLLFEVKKK